MIQGATCCERRTERDKGSSRICDVTADCMSTCWKARTLAACESSTAAVLFASKNVCCAQACSSALQNGISAAKMQLHTAAALHYSKRSADCAVCLLWRLQASWAAASAASASQLQAASMARTKSLELAHQQHLSTTLLLAAMGTQPRECWVRMIRQHSGCSKTRQQRSL